MADGDVALERYYGEDDDGAAVGEALDEVEQLTHRLQQPTPARDVRLGDFAETNVGSSIS